MKVNRLKVAFLFREDDIYAIQRIKGLLSIGNIVYGIIIPGKDLNLLNIKGLTTYFLTDNNNIILKRIIFRKQIKEILSVIKPDVFHVTSALNLFYTKTDIPKITIIENQGSDVITLPKKLPLIKLFYKYYFKFVDGVVQDSEIAKSKGIECGATAESNKNKVIDIGIDTEIFNTKIKKNVFIKKYNLEGKIIGFSSRSFKKNYNIDIIIHSLAKIRSIYPNIVYVFAGNHGDLDESLKKYIQDNNLEKNILFLNYVDHERGIKFIYRDANFVISVPSSDSSPASVYEAIACETPVIVSDLPWLKNKFIKGIDLEVVPVRDINKLSETIINVLNNKSKIQLNKAMEKVYKNMNYKKEAEKLYQFYSFILSTKSKFV